MASLLEGITRFSRRKFIVTGAVTGATALLPPALMQAASGAVSKNGNASNFISLKQSSDQSFASEVDSLFPGLLEDPIFQQIKSHAVLVKNVSGQAINAHSTVWTALIPEGTFSTTRLHYFHPSTKRPTLTAHFGKKGNKTRFTGKIPVLKAGATRLITPYFNWSPRYYRMNKHRLDWNTILTVKASRMLFLKKLSTATKIQVSVDAVIVNHNKVIGPDSGHLAKIFRKSRNAEHDEALVILRLVQSGASPKVVADVLRQHATLPFSSHTSPSSDPIYLAARRRIAKVLLRRLKHGKPEQFSRTLNYLIRQPKTTTGLHLKKKA